MEELIGLVAVIGGLGLTGFIFGNIFKLIRAKINSNNFNEEAFNRLARAFSKHKKDSERRFQNLEAIIAGDEPSGQLDSSNQSLQDDITTKSIEIEDAEPAERESDDNNLRNMLRG
ncbi:MAG TPA: hypothetical protein VFG39_06935 [Balneolaceae bacterium]|nr:hypothetical protein [Balneolaceae bacterium]